MCGENESMDIVIKARIRYIIPKYDAPYSFCVEIGTDDGTRIMLENVPQRAVLNFVESLAYQFKSRHIRGSNEIMDTVEWLGRMKEVIKDIEESHKDLLETLNKKGDKND